MDQLKDKLRSNNVNKLDYQLSLEDMPTQWFNFFPHLPKPLPPVRDNGKRSTLEISQLIRPKILLEQNAPKENWIDIPEEVINKLIMCGRPTPLRRALSLEKHLKTPARIYFKREDTMATGSFKLSTAVAQAYYAKQEGREILISETGAGQWGMSVALVSQMFGLDARIFMARCSLEQKPYRQHYMKMLGCEVYPSPSTKTECGKELLLQTPGHPGSIGTAISEAIENALDTPGSAYLSGSNVNHVHLHQTLLGLEVKQQLSMAGESNVDHLVACVSGGSNLCGFMMPFLPEKNSGAKIDMLGVESTASPRLTQGTYEYCRSDVAGYTPEVLSHSMGESYIPAPVHVGGLRNHNSSPLVSLLCREGILRAEALDEFNAFKAGQIMLKTEGILVAPESSHAVAAAIELAEKARIENKESVIVFLASGNGFLDLQGYNDVLNN